MLFNVFDAFVSLGGGAIDAKEIIKGIGETFNEFLSGNDLIWWIWISWISSIFLNSFLLCGGVWRFPVGFCVRPADVSVEQMHQERPDHWAGLHLRPGILVLPHRRDAVAVVHPLVRNLFYRSNLAKISTVDVKLRSFCFCSEGSFSAAFAVRSTWTPTWTKAPSKLSVTPWRSSPTARKPWSSSSSASPPSIRPSGSGTRASSFSRCSSSSSTDSSVSFWPSLLWLRGKTTSHGPDPSCLCFRCVYPHLDAEQVPTCPDKFCWPDNYGLRWPARGCGLWTGSESEWVEDKGEEPDGVHDSPRRLLHRDSPGERSGLVGCFLSHDSPFKPSLIQTLSFSPLQKYINTTFWIHSFMHLIHPVSNRKFLQNRK